MFETATPPETDGAQVALKMVGLRQQIDKLEVRFSLLAAAYKKTDHWDLEGANTALDWIRINCHMTSTAAADRLAVGERLMDLSETAAAMEAGDIGFAHVTVMARTARATGQAFDEGRLVKLARAHSPGKFFYQSLHY